MKVLSNVLQKFLIYCLLILVAPIFWDNMKSGAPFIITQGQEASSLQEPSTSGGDSINRTLDRSAKEPISQDAVMTGSFGDDCGYNI